MLVRNILSSSVRHLLRLRVNHAVVNSGVVNPRSQARPFIEMGPITLNTLFALRSLSYIDHSPDPGASAAARGQARGDSLLAGYFINSEGGWWR